MDGGDDFISDEISERLHRHLGVQGAEVSEGTRGLFACPRTEEGPLWLELSRLAGEGLLEGFESLNLDEATAKLFLYENAARVFRVDGA